MDKQSAIAKIRKCMALAKGGNANEAGVALRQAQALMEKFGVDDADLLAAEVTEMSTPSNARKNPARWESYLASTIGKAFACDAVHSHTRGKPGAWLFIGPAIQAEIATYAFAVLNRKIKLARTELLRSPLCARLRPRRKTARADLFCEQFVVGLREHVREFAGTQQTDAIAAYKAIHYPVRGLLDPKDRNAERELSSADYAAARSGQEAGRQVRLSQAVGSSAEKAAALMHQLTLEHRS
ncbi:DUF2786 domain-containing protein [Silvimonas sp. JCM 19000]